MSHLHLSFFPNHFVMGYLLLGLEWFYDMYMFVNCGKGKVVSLHTLKAYRGSGAVALSILYLGTR
jgi:hypothetical protein